MTDKQINAQYIGWFTDTGETPEPKMRHARCSIVSAFTELSSHGAAFIRRPNWVQGTELYKAAGHYTLNAEDILSNDWEIWA